MLDQWQNALAQKNIHLIKEVLKKGYIPDNLKGKGSDVKMQFLLSFLRRRELIF